MTPGQYPLEIYRGDTYRWQFLLWADANKTTPADLGDVVAAAQIRSPNKLLVDIVCTITLPNVIDGYLSAASSKTLVAGKGSWDLQLTHADGDVATVLGGVVSVLPCVTNSE